MTISYEVRKAVVLLKHSSFFDKICNYSEPCKSWQNMNGMPAFQVIFDWIYMAK